MKAVNVRKNQGLEVGFFFLLNLSKVSDEGIELGRRFEGILDEDASFIKLFDFLDILVFLIGAEKGGFGRPTMLMFEQVRGFGRAVAIGAARIFAFLMLRVKDIFDAQLAADEEYGRGSRHEATGAGESRNETCSAPDCFNTSLHATKEGTNNEWPQGKIDGDSIVSRQTAIRHVMSQKQCRVTVR